MTETPAENGTAAPPVPFISRVRLRNYKSIAECDVRLSPLTILVGPNASGKSNFLDALAFLRRAVTTTPAEAIQDRGGLGEILRRVPETAKSLSIAIDSSVSWGALPGQRVDASYEFEIGPSPNQKNRSFEVIREVCELRQDNEIWHFRAERGRVDFRSPGQGAGSAVFEADRLYLLLASAQPAFAPFFAGLRGIEFYNFDPEAMRRPTPPTTGAVMGRTGEHLGDVLGALDADSPHYKQRIDAYLHSIVPGIISVERDHAGQYVTTTMRTSLGADGEEVRFGPESMSDGTIRAVAVLAALFQPWVLEGRIRLVGIEEPEIALHPSAAGVLFDALTEASEHVQVLATSQSADLLDREDLDISVIRSVAMRDGQTLIGEVDDVSRENAESKLYTLGELMRANQLTPKPPAAGDATSEQA